MNLFELAIVVSAVDRATSVLTGVQGAINGASRAAEKMKGWGQSAAVAGALVDGASKQIIGALNGIVVPANDVETALSQVSVALGDASSVEALGRVQSAAVSWSKIHVDTAKGFIDATNTMAQAGLNEGQALAGANVALAVATATMGEGTKAADLLAILYNNVADKTKDARIEMTRLGDIVTKTQNVFQIKDLQQFSEGLKFGVPSANAYGIAIEELSAVIGTLNNAGLAGSMAGTAFSSTMSNMLKASKELKFEIARTASGGVDFTGTLKNLENQFGAINKMTPETVQAFQRTFGDEGFRGLALMLGKSKDVEASLKSIQNASGATVAAQKTLESTRAAGFQVITNQVTALKIAIADQLTPAIQAIQPVIMSAIAAMADFVVKHPDLVRYTVIFGAILGAVLAIVGPILLAVGAVGMFAGHVTAGAAMIGSFGTALLGLLPGLISATVAAWGFAAALLANPITWIVLAVVAAAVLIYKYWGPIKAFFGVLWDAVKVGFASAWNAVLGVWGKVTGFFSGIWANIKGAFQKSFIGGVMTVLSYITPVGLIIRAFSALWPWLSTLPGRFMAALRSLGTAIVGAAIAAKDSAMGMLSSLWTGLQSLWTSMVTWFKLLPLRIALALIQVAVTVANAITAAKDRVFAILASIGAALSGFFLGGIRNDFAAVGNFLSTAWQTIKAAFDGGIMGVLGLFARFNVVTLIARALDAVVQWLFGFSLFQAGSNILDTLTRGIKAAAAGPVDAVMAVVQKVRNLLPFSPAKAGPLRDLHRVRLIETIADTVRAAPLVRAMSGVATAAVATLPAAATAQSTTIAMASPTVLPLPRPSQGRGAGGTGDPSEGGVVNHFHIAGDASEATVAALDAWAKSNAKLLRRIVKREEENEKRGEFS